MASKHNKKRRADDYGEPKHSIKPETVQAVTGIVFFVLTFFFVLAAFNKAGFVGELVYKWLGYLVGVGYFALPTLLALLAVSAFKNLEKRFTVIKWISSILLFLSILGLVNMFTGSKGGIIGSFVSKPLVSLFDFYASSIFLIAIVLSTTLIILDARMVLPSLTFLTGKIKSKKESSIGEMSAESDEEETPEKEEDEEQELEEREGRPNLPLVIPNMNEIEMPRPKEPQRRFASYKKFVPIPLELLENDRGKPGVGDIKANANIIKRTLQTFGIDVEMDEVTIGPSVTRYALKPAEGVKISRILSLQDNLSLALAAHPIRIEAPIPGKSLVGIEIPNSVKTTVGLGSLLASEEFQSSDKPILVSIGKGISGKSHFGNLAKMPHLLIAGATGSGKSVAIHAIITSLLYRNSPENLRFIMIDPKRVELTLYNKIPHLQNPVITDAKKAIQALRWAATEMERRYNILEGEKVRDIESYHKNIFEPELERMKRKKSDLEESKMPEIMPYIVIVIDELADIMTAYPRELEAAVVRLAQMSRAVGIHLILSTQRPSVNVITGLIKANIPARIALQVASQIDSRTILDMAGAEKLLGAGDMLYLSGEMSKPQRIQSAFISENEVKKVVKFLVDEYKDEPSSEIDFSQAISKDVLFESSLDGDNNDEDDDLYEQAREEVLRAGKASTSYLQRKLSIGYARAARLIDLLEERGVIGKGDGAKPREVLGAPSITPQDFPPQEL